VDRTAADVGGAEGAKGRTVRGTGRILLVEDDESVRHYVSSILESAPGTP